MTYPQVDILKTYADGVDFQEMCKLAEGKRLISNKEADVVLQDEELYKKHRALFTCWTGTMMIYVAAGTPFKDFVRFSNLVFDVPEKFRGLKDKALVIEHPKWKTSVIEVPYGGKLTKILASEDDIDVIDFPVSDGWYLPEEKHGIPTGEKSNSRDKSARYLWRRDDEDYICPLARYDDVVGGRRDVYANRRPDVRLGVGLAEGTLAELSPAVAPEVGVAPKDPEITALFGAACTAESKLLDAVEKLPRHGKKCNCEEEPVGYRFTVFKVQTLCLNCGGKTR